MPRVMTMQGATEVGAPVNVSGLPSGWGWPQWAGVILGVAAIGGGSTLAWTGYRSKKTWQMYTGVGVGVAGLVSLGVSIWVANVGTKALLGAARDSYLPPPETSAVARVGSKVILRDGRRGVIEDVDVMSGGSQYQVKIGYSDGEWSQEPVELDQIERVL